MSTATKPDTALEAERLMEAAKEAMRDLHRVHSTLADIARRLGNLTDELRAQEEQD